MDLYSKLKKRRKKTIYYYIYDSKNALRRSPIPKINSSDETTLFTFVRNPYRRILSCFFSKVVSESDEKYFFLRDCLVGKYTMNPKDSNQVNFKKFLNFVEDKFNSQNLQDINVHWRPQTTNIFRGNPNIDYIGRIETFRNQMSFI